MTVVILTCACACAWALGCTAAGLRPSGKSPVFGWIHTAEDVCGFHQYLHAAQRVLHFNQSRVSSRSSLWGCLLLLVARVILLLPRILLIVDLLDLAAGRRRVYANAIL